MKEPTNTKDETRRKTRQVILAMMALLISGGTLASLTYLQGQANKGQYAQQNKYVPDMAPALQNARKKKAAELRERWRVWAIEHKADLKRMLNGDKNAQNLVWQSLPTLPESPSPLTHDILDAGVCEYSWQPVLKISDWSTFQSSEGGKAQMRHNMQVDLQNGFQDYQDIWIAKSGNSGSKTVSLWASGRVTETETVENTPHRSGQPTFKEVSRELVPPYHFLN